MKKLLDLIIQRRIWIAVIGTVLFVSQAINVELNIEDTDKLADLITAVAQALAGLVTTVLALLSYLKPKK